MAGDLKIFPARNDTDMDWTVRRRDSAGLRLVGRIVDGDAKKIEAMADAASNSSAAFADTSGENEHVESAEHCGISCDHLTNRLTKDRNRKLCLLISAIRCSFQIAHVGLASRKCGQAGIAIQ